MYESFYGLKEKPFQILPDPGYLFMSKGHENAYIHLEYAVFENKGFVVITGEIGSGKTTLINLLLNKIQQDIQVALINNTCIQPGQLLKMICQEFELQVSGMDETEMRGVFYSFLLEEFSRNRRVTLIIDEAQNLATEMLEQLRLLSNLEAEKHHLLQMVLVGQPELKYKLQRKELEQFVQRITVHCHLDALNPEEVDDYIRFRLKVAGAEKHDIFGQKAVESISNYSKGIPRLINILCDTALVYGFADGLKTIDEKVIENVVTAREAGGIFTKFGGDHPAGDASDNVESVEVEATGFDLSQNRFQLMGQRFRLLENRIDCMEQRLSDLTDGKKSRDVIVLELMKMVKQGMESRGNLLMKFIRLKHNMELIQKKSDQKKVQPKRDQKEEEPMKAFYYD
ncbi:MAG: AAA family ATPase [Desulfobacterales bacterium]|nr:AAA family ATPase [Desulfobacterales bacterium]MDD4072114.1 AAA family ATPase [Desulfobacterales bacterium]MDD4392751.1 AAA family ATPase [Desulfobacterales bacterium]